MKIEKFVHKGVSADGKCKDGGAVYTAGHIGMSQKNGGCGETTCHCSDGHWISVALPRTRAGVVEGIKILFDDEAELKTFLKQRSLTMEVYR